MAYDDVLTDGTSKWNATKVAEFVAAIKARIAHADCTAENDFLVGAPTGGSFVKKTLAEVKTILGLGSAAYTDTTAYEPADADIQSHLSSTSNPHSVTAAQTGAATTSTKLDDFATPDDNTDLDANTTNHGLLLKATAPAENVLNVVGIANGETAYANKALFDATNPAMNGTAAPGTSLYASHRDHVHASDTSRVATADIDTDSTFAANSDSKVPSQKAVKTAIGAVTPPTRELYRLSYLLDLNGAEKEINSGSSQDRQASNANGDRLYWVVYCTGGETKLYFYVSKASNRAIFDLYINGVLDSSGYDLYSASTLDATITITPTQPIISGVNEIKLVINGKNASSSAYYILGYGMRVGQ
jgi:hypothetical protein